MSEVKHKINIRKWIYLGFSILITAFIMVHSFLPASQSAKWSNVFVRFFMNLFNGAGGDNTEIINVTGIDLKYDTNYSYNFIEGYADNEIAINTTKRLNASILPTNATNSAVSYKVSDESIVKITQDQNYAYVTGLAEGSVTITATSLGNNSYTSTYNFNVVNPKAPVTYLVSDIEVYQGSLFYLPITTQNEEYYDVNKLDIINSSPTVAYKSEINDLYYASSIGEDNFSIKDTSFKVTVKDASSITLPTFSSIEGKDVITSNSSGTYKAIVSNEATSNDVYWEVSDTSKASVNKYGLVKAYDIKEESKITLTAHSLLYKEVVVSKEITLKPVTITSFELVIPYYGNHVTNMPYLGETGQEIKVWIEDNTGTIALSGVIVSSSDPSVAEVYAQGSYIYINCIKEGDTRITVTSINNPEVSKYIDLQVVIRGVINNDNYLSFSEFVRKSIGHFLLFMADGIFTFLFLYELNKEVKYKGKKEWHYVVFSLVLGILLAGLSELIQHFVPTRFGSFKDVAVDSLGFILGALITYLIIYLIKRHQNKKIKENEASNKEE
ncbi:MAG: VanZ family protein [Bacilli bacterium]|nr:VanZ family protein [Bacilli bacterium]